MNNRQKAKHFKRKYEELRRMTLPVRKIYMTDSRYVRKLKIRQTVSDDIFAKSAWSPEAETPLTCVQRSMCRQLADGLMELTVFEAEPSMIPDHTDFSSEVKIPKDKAVIELVDDENTLERALFHFSFLEKMTERLDNGKFRMTLYYPVSDKTEILIRILSFGHQLNVISEGYIREEIGKRLAAQMELFY